MKIENLKYPIGKFKAPSDYSARVLRAYIETLETFPSRIRKETEQLKDEQLETPYRNGGWNIRQVVNHCADSHMNALIRFKLALTEDRPTIKPYSQDAWAGRADTLVLEL